ncbi:MAG: YrvL family regulatory protein [Eubacterium sp.]
MLKLKKISKSFAVFLYMVLDTIATFLGFYLVDVSMSSVASSNISLLVLALIFAALGISDITEKTNN